GEAASEGKTQGREVRPLSLRASGNVDGHGSAGVPLELGGVRVLGIESEVAAGEVLNRERGFSHAVDHLHRGGSENVSIDSPPTAYPDSVHFCTRLLYRIEAYRN